MEKRFKLSIGGLFLVLGSLQPACAQIAPSEPSANTAASAASTPSAAQASEEMTKKITDLVSAGKYAEAQQLTTGLLVAFPDDQRLIKAKSLLEELLAPARSTVATAAATTNPPESHLPVNTLDTKLSGMDKVDYNALILLARQSQQDTDLEGQKASLRQFMQQSSVFLQKHPDQTLLWQLRAASALSLEDPMAGYEAGHKLLESGGADSNDTNLQQLLAQLKNKGWLDMQGAAQAQEDNWLRSLTLILSYGQWSTGHLSVSMKSTLTLTVSGLGDLKEPIRVRVENVSPKTCRVDEGPTGIITIKPGDVAGGTFTTTWKATRLGMRSYAVPCTVTGSIFNKAGKEISRATLGDGY